MKVALVAGEASGDTLGAGLIEALKQRHPDIEFVGIGGEKMREAGCELWWHSDELAVMGLVEVLQHLPRLLKLRKQLKQRLLADPPDIFVGIDAPDFNLGLELDLKQNGIFTTHYVSPSVWAWRQNRVKKIKRGTDLMLTLLPFEAEFYQQHNVPVAFVGHPLADELDGSGDVHAAREALGLQTDAPTVAILPGSRGGEVDYLAEPFLQAAAILQQKKPDIQFVLPLARPGLREKITLAATSLPALNLIIVDGEAQTAMVAADAILIASGTATLEAMLLAKPMVVGYGFAPLSYEVFKRMVKIDLYSLPNLLAGKEVVPEYIQDRLQPRMLANAVMGLLNNKQRRGLMLEAFAAAHKQLRQDASAHSAEAILQHYQQQRAA